MDLGVSSTIQVTNTKVIGKMTKPGVRERMFGRKETCIKVSISSIRQKLTEK